MTTKIRFGKDINAQVFVTVSHPDKHQRSQLQARAGNVVFRRLVRMVEGVSFEAEFDGEKVTVTRMYNPTTGETASEKETRAMTQHLGLEYDAE